jgi:threonylcarbamoyladenosine tRNA methylthiotransferase MtaB
MVKELPGLIRTTLFIMKRVALHTLGCKLNYAETAAIGRRFTSEGYSVVDIDGPADVIVINTCSVTDHADRECRQLVRRALRRSPEAVVAVVGCYTQLHPERIAEIHGVDLVLGNQEKDSLFDRIHKTKKRLTPEVYVSCVSGNPEFKSASSVGFEDRTRAFLKVQDGCDYKCSFCTIPLARGRSRSIFVPEALAQAAEAVSHGYREIVLTGVNVGDFGNGNEENLLSLLQQLAAINDLLRIRVSSIEVNLLTDELLEFWLAEEKLCKHWHIPLQSGSADILRRMRRRYRPELYAERIRRIKTCAPDAAIGADVIVGFPGEGEKQFEKTYEFIDNLPISYLHVFTYSERPDTPAATFDHRVEPAVRAERNRKLRELGASKKEEFYGRFVGRTVSVLVESRRPDGTYHGLTGEYVRVNLQGADVKVNEIIRAKIEALSDGQCIGKLPNSGDCHEVGSTHLLECER